MGLAQSRRPELADVGRLARRLVFKAVDAARTEDKPLRRLLLDHLGADADGLPAVSGSWPSYEHVNLQAGLDAWLAGPGRRFELLGIAGAMRGMDYGIGWLIADPGGQAGTKTGQAASIRVTDDHMAAALDQLLDIKSQLTRVLLGSAQPGDARPGEARHGAAPWPGPPRPAEL